MNVVLAIPRTGFLQTYNIRTNLLCHHGDIFPRKVSWMNLSDPVGDGFKKISAVRPLMINEDEEHINEGILHGISCISHLGFNPSC